ncbi:MAG: hypothetical protein Q9N34_01135 [Aquificota bacterium]|nr:hypothetical protein [Aquificota bacterium]
MPKIKHLLLDLEGIPEEHRDVKLYLIRRKIEREGLARQQGLHTLPLQ